MGRNARRVKNDDDEHVREEEPTNKVKSNLQFTKKHNLSENSHQADCFKDFLANKLVRECECGTDLWAICANVKGLLSNLGHER